jgi:hypothetical protein
VLEICSSFSKLDMVWIRMGYGHPQSTYIYRVQSQVSGVFRTIDPTPPLHPASVSFPRTNARGGTHSPGGEGAGESIFRKTPDIGLASYSIIPLRGHLSTDTCCTGLRKTSLCWSRWILNLCRSGYFSSCYFFISSCLSLSLLHMIKVKRLQF